MSFIKKYKNKISNSPISRLIFKLYQIGLGLAIVFSIKLRKTILNNWKSYLIYIAVTVPMCLIWTIALYRHDTTAPWFFWEHTLLFSGIHIEILGCKFVVEDIFFFFFGQTLGFIFYNYFLNKPSKENRISIFLNNHYIKILWIILFGIIFYWFTEIDYISVVNFTLFAFPSIFLWFILIDEIDLYKFLKYSLIMGGIVYFYDFSQTTLLPLIMHKLGAENPDQYCLWFYQFSCKFSKVYSSKTSMWLWYTEPIGMVLLFPYSGMLFQAGLMCCLRKLMKKE